MFTKFNKPSTKIYKVLDKPRTDIAHLIKAVSNWKCFITVTDLRVKQFYLRSIGYMTTLHDFKNFTSIFKAVVTIAETQADTFYVITLKKKLIDCIRSFRMDDCEMDENDGKLNHCDNDEKDHIIWNESEDTMVDVIHSLKTEIIEEQKKRKWWIMKKMKKEISMTQLTLIKKVMTIIYHQ